MNREDEKSFHNNAWEFVQFIKRIKKRSSNKKDERMKKARPTITNHNHIDFTLSQNNTKKNEVNRCLPRTDSLQWEINEFIEGEGKNLEWLTVCWEMLAIEKNEKIYWNRHWFT